MLEPCGLKGLMPDVGLFALMSHKVRVCGLVISMDRVQAQSNTVTRERLCHSIRYDAGDL